MCFPPAQDDAWAGAYKHPDAALTTTQFSKDQVMFEVDTFGKPQFFHFHAVKQCFVNSICDTAAKCRVPPSAGPGRREHPRPPQGEGCRCSTGSSIRPFSSSATSSAAAWKSSTPPGPRRYEGDRWRRRPVLLDFVHTIYGPTGTLMPMDSPRDTARAPALTPTVRAKVVRIRST